MMPKELTLPLMELLFHSMFLLELMLLLKLKKLLSLTILPINFFTSMVLVLSKTLLLLLIALIWLTKPPLLKPLLSFKLSLTPKPLSSSHQDNTSLLLNQLPFNFTHNWTTLLFHHGTLKLFFQAPFQPRLSQLLIVLQKLSLLTTLLTFQPSKVLLEFINLPFLITQLFKSSTLSLNTPLVQPPTPHSILLFSKTEETLAHTESFLLFLNSVLLIQFHTHQSLKSQLPFKLWSFNTNKFTKFPSSQKRPLLQFKHSWNGSSMPTALKLPLERFLIP